MNAAALIDIGPTAGTVSGEAPLSGLASGSGSAKTLSPSNVRATWQDILAEFRQQTATAHNMGKTRSNLPPQREADPHATNIAPGLSQRLRPSSLKQHAEHGSKQESERIESGTHHRGHAVATSELFNPQLPTPLQINPVPMVLVDLSADATPSSSVSPSTKDASSVPLLPLRSELSAHAGTLSEIDLADARIALPPEASLPKASMPGMGDDGDGPAVISPSGNSAPPQAPPSFMVSAPDDSTQGTAHSALNSEVSRPQEPEDPSAAAASFASTQLVNQSVPSAARSEVAPTTTNNLKPRLGAEHPEQSATVVGGNQVVATPRERSSISGRSDPSDPGSVNSAAAQRKGDQNPLMKELTQGPHPPLAAHAQALASPSVLEAASPMSHQQARSSPPGIVPHPLAAASDTFSALDASTVRPAITWHHAGQRQAEAGYLDPGLGWVAVRAETTGGAIHASIVPSSADAAHMLDTHLAGLHSFVSKQLEHATTITIDPSGHDQLAGGFNHSSQHRQSSDGRTDTPNDAATPTAHTNTPPTPHAHTYTNYAPPGAHISVLA